MFRRISTRLTLTLVAVLGLVQAGLIVTLDQLLESRLRTRFATALQRRAESVLRAHELVREKTAAETPRGRWSLALDPFEQNGLLLSVDIPGEPAVTSPGLRGTPIPATSRPLQRVPAGIIAARPDEPFLVVSRALPDGGTLRVASSLATLDDTLGQTRIMLALLALLAIAATALLSWWILRRGLEPLTTVTRHLRQASAADLDRQLPLPTREDELHELVEAYNRMAARLESQFQNQRQFVGRVAHELKTPLAILSGRLQTRRADFSDGALADALQAELRHMQRIVDGFLILSRGQHHDALRNARLVSLEDVVVQVLARCRQSAAERGVRLVPSFVSAQASEPEVRGDPDLLISMVENLVRNAIRHSPADAVVSIGLDATADQIVIRVADRGPGIAAEMIPQIFDPFVQGASSQRSGASGLGLAIVRSIARLHGGGVRVESHLGSGSTFLVSLPAAT